MSFNSIYNLGNLYEHSSILSVIFAVYRGFVTCKLVVELTIYEIRNISRYNLRNLYEH